MTRFDAVNYVSHGIAKLPGDSIRPLMEARRIVILSSERDKAFEEWLGAVIGSAGFESDLFRSSIRPGDHIPKILSNVSEASDLIAIISPDFQKTPLYKILTKKAVFNTVTSRRTLIPLVVGNPVITAPLAEVAQVSLSNGTAEETCGRLFSALDYSGSYEIHAELLAAALRERRAPRKLKKQKGQLNKPIMQQEVVFKKPEFEPGPDLEPGPEFDFTSAGLSLIATHPPRGLFDDRTQRQLHERLKQTAPLLAQASGGSNAHRGLANVTMEYGELVTRPFEEIDVVSLWAVGVGLLANRDAFARAHDSGVMTEPLEPALFALLQQVCEVHGGFILGFPTARELSNRADQARISGAAMERVVFLAREIIQELRNSNQVDAHTRRFLAAIEEGLVEPGWRITRAGYAAYVVTRNALIAIGRMLNWANSTFATVIGGIALAQVDPGLVQTQFWLEFVLKNSQQIIAFAEPFPELKIWLAAQIEAAKQDKELRSS